jgi:two-component system chemotaxis sensor kinase CheA
VLITQLDGQAIGLLVDEIFGHEEVVVKPLPPALRNMPGLAGITILGEGQAVLILDVSGIIGRNSQTRKGRTG